MIGFDTTPRLHPRFGAWGTTPTMTKIDLPLLSRCLALDADGRRLLWFSHDLVGLSVPATTALRTKVADALGLTVEQVIWSTSQTHAGGAFPGFAEEGGGSSIMQRGEFDEQFCRLEHDTFVTKCIDAANQAIETLEPVSVLAGRAHCDNISYNSRLPLPTGGVKFSRNYAEALQGGRYFDTTVSLLRFDDRDGRPIGLLFNFCCHPATLLSNEYLSPDYVGTARKCLEQSIGGAPAMFTQGFCGNVHNYYMFCGPPQAKMLGERLGSAAVKSLPHMVPVRGRPFNFESQTVELDCRPMYSRAELEHAIAIRRDFQREVEHYPHACWAGGVNVPEFLTADQKQAFVQVTIDYCTQALRMLDAGQSPRTSLPLTLAAVRIGDVYAAVSPGENFTETGRQIRSRSPHTHTLICGDTNGLFGYIGDDEEIERGGFETDTYWKMTHRDGFRLAPAKGSAQRVADTCIGLIHKLAT